MSPAGYWPQLSAAIEAGADAVYFGLKHFSARAKVGFTLRELPDVMRALHRRGVRGYLTFNTLIFEHELEEAARTIAAIAEAGVDAMIVHDYAAVRMARQIAPQMELHASTQMSITNADGVRFAQSFGLRRVTLARELSLEEVRSIAEETGCDLEIFVHGALCVAYSGQCFSSEAWGGRSANRGQCAQACRLPYEMIVDGRRQPLADARYLLSPGDLYALEQIPRIIDSGVAALKIEGRYKDAKYVALTTQAYRNAVDQAWNGGFAGVAPGERLQLEQVYSRGFGPFFMTGTNHQAVVEGRAPRHRGVLMGRVARIEAGAVWVETAEAQRIAPLKAGDGIVFDAADWRSPEEPEEGGRVYEAAASGKRVALRFAKDAIRFDRVRVGDRVWRTHDPDSERAAKRFLDPPTPVARQPVRVAVTGREGDLLEAEWSLEKRPEISVVVKSPAPLGRARNRALTAEMLCEQFGRLGQTPYQLSAVEYKTNEALFVSVSALNQMRRQAVEALEKLQTGVAPAGVRPFEFPRIGGHPAPPPGAPRIHVLVRTPEQLDSAIELRPASVTLDYLDLYGLRPSVERVKSAGLAARAASPRVLKPGEQRILNFLRSLECAILIRSPAMIQALAGVELIGDFSLNAANSLAAEMYLNLGLTRLTPGHDLNAAQITELARRAGPDRIEAIMYQHLPVFHTEHCVFCRFLSTGTSYRDCGRPCERHRVELKDQTGRAHPVMADVGCRNTVFGAEAQEATAHLRDWLSAGIRDFRIEFAHESGEQARRVVQTLEQALGGEPDLRKIAAELAKAAPQGATQGSLFVPHGYCSLPVLP